MRTMNLYVFLFKPVTSWIAQCITPTNQWWFFHASGYHVFVLQSENQPTITRGGVDIFIFTHGIDTLLPNCVLFMFQKRIKRAIIWSVYMG